MQNVQMILKKHNYELGRVLGKGSFGECFVIHSTFYRQDFACKVFSIEDEEKKESIKKSFQREVDALLQINHPNIIRIYDYFNEGDLCFLVLELCEGGSIDQKIKQKKKINLADLKRYARQIIAAMKVCHHQMISHLDIKPANLLLDIYDRIKVADFGLSQFKQKGEKTNIFNGSRVYMAPEIIAKQPYDPYKADVWSFGVTLYKMATGTLPFDGNSPSEIKSQLSVGIEYTTDNFDELTMKIVKKCLRFNAELRPTFDELGEMIEKDPTIPKTSLLNPHYQRGSLLNFNPLAKKTNGFMARAGSSILRPVVHTVKTKPKPKLQPLNILADLPDS